MIERATPVRTQLGELHGRNAVYLEEISQKGLTVILTGEINSDLCRGEAPKGSWLRYRLSFCGVLAYECREMEVCRWQTVSSFDEVEDSEWLRQLGLIARAHELKHELGSMQPRDYVLWTYDWVYRFASTRFELEILGERPKELPKRRREK